MFHFGPTVFDILRKDLAQQRFITTYSKSLDELLLGGIALGQITEVCGTSGAGKTQLSLQACLTVQLSEERGGVAGRAIYVDTDGCFSTRRLIQMAEAYLSLQATIDTTDTEPGNLLSTLPPAVRALFDNVNCVRVHDAAQLMRALDCVEAELERAGDCHATMAITNASAEAAPPPKLKRLLTRPPLKLLVVDNVAAVLRHSCLLEQPAVLEQWQSALDSTAAAAEERTLYMNTIAVQLTRIAKKHDLAVLVVNQMTSYEHEQPAQQQEADQADLQWGAKPALGESWSHVCSLRVMLARDPSTAAVGVRLACLLKDYARAACSETVQVQLASEGVRDLPN